MAEPAQKRERYRLQQPLGRGGQGHTYRAEDTYASGIRRTRTEDTRTDGAVAVKVIELRGADSWKPFDLFERECRTLRSLDHPGIPRFLDTFAEEELGRYYLVMELVEGRSLGELLADGQLLSEAQLWNILHQALEILSYLHGRHPPVIHRDIKPANLIRRPDGRLALVDFGGVRVALREEGGSTVVGTFGYLAPEQLHGEATPATDIYSLGATLATLATGVEADKLPRRGLKVDLDNVMPPSALRDLLSRMLEPDPDNRLASVSAVRAAAGAARTPASPAPPGPPTAAPTNTLAEAEEGAEEDPLADVGGPLRLVLKLFGMVGYVGLTVLDALILPLIFVMLGAAWSSRPGKLNQLEERKRSIRRVLRSGRRSMRALGRGRDPYRQIEGRRAPPALPPPPPRRGRRRGRRRLRR
jgi:serine/threonine protein kinase